MKVSVSLPGEDVRFLDEYAREQGLESRSAAVHKPSTLSVDTPPRDDAFFFDTLAMILRSTAPKRKKKKDEKTSTRSCGGMWVVSVDSPPLTVTGGRGTVDRTNKRPRVAVGLGRVYRMAMHGMQGFFLLWLAAGCLAASAADAPIFPSELVDFGPVSRDPLFAGGGPQAWDRDLRERGWIMREGNCWHLWYTGSNADRSPFRRVGYATGSDGLNW